MNHLQLSTDNHSKDGKDNDHDDDGDDNCVMVMIMMIAQTVMII